MWEFLRLSHVIEFTNLFQEIKTLAHILQMNKVVKELYEGDGICNGAKYIFTIYEDDSVKLTFFNGNTRVEEPAVKLIDIGTNGGKRIEYGTTNVKSSLPFRKYVDGTLDERWEQIK